MADVDNSQNVLDSRDVIQRLYELESDLNDAFEEVSEEHRQELEDMLEEAYLGIFADEDGDVSTAAPTLAEYVVIVAFDGHHPLQADALELRGLNAKETFKCVEDLIRTAAQDGDHPQHEEAAEYRALKTFADQLEGYGDWRHGEALIRESYFTEFVEQLADDIGAIDKNNASWIVIDWEQTAENVKTDYTSAYLDGVEYLMRS